VAFTLQKLSHIEEVTDTRGVGYNPFSRIAADLIGTVFFHEDLRGSTVRVSDEHGNTVARVVYDAWGRPTAKPVSSFNFAGIDDLINFTGYRYDEVMGVFISCFRIYDPLLRRFISEDPIRDGWNWYAYVGNNPIMYIDHLGLAQISIRQFISDVVRIMGDIDHHISYTPGVEARFMINDVWLNIPIGGAIMHGMRIDNCPVRGMVTDSRQLSAFFFGHPTNISNNPPIQTTPGDSGSQQGQGGHYRPNHRPPAASDSNSRPDDLPSDGNEDHFDESYALRQPPFVFEAIRDFFSGRFSNEIRTATLFIDGFAGTTPVAPPGAMHSSCWAAGDEWGIPSLGEATELNMAQEYLG